MTESLKTQLIKAGVDVNSVLERFMGNEALLERFLKKFPQDENYQKLCSAMEARDLDAAITASHTLKGVSRQPIHHSTVRPFEQSGGRPSVKRLAER